MIRINKYISSSGVCSRRKAEEYIKNGKVKVNGKVIFDLATIIDETKDIVMLNNNVIKINNDKIYIMLNKPIGYITTNNEQFGRKCTLDLIKENIRVFPIGRLDMDTEGLLLFTNDGEFSNKLMHPKNKIYKTYIVKLNRNVTKDMIFKLTHGVDIGGYITKEAKVRLIAKDIIEIRISEGKNRQVRKMCKAVGLKVLNLKRISIGHLQLGNLKLGTYRYLKKEDLKKIFE